MISKCSLVCVFPCQDILGLWTRSREDFYITGNKYREKLACVVSLVNNRRSWPWDDAWSCPFIYRELWVDWKPLELQALLLSSQWSVHLPSLDLKILLVQILFLSMVKVGIFPTIKLDNSNLQYHVWDKNVTQMYLQSPNGHSFYRCSSSDWGTHCCPCSWDGETGG